MKKIFFSFIFIFYAFPSFAAITDPSVHLCAKSTNGNSVTSSGLDTTNAKTLFAATSGDANPPTFTDSLTLTWHLLSTLGPSGGSYLFWANNPSGNVSQTFTINDTGSAPALCIVGLNGVSTSPFDASTSAISSPGTSIAPGPVTTSASTNVAVASITFGDTGVSAVGATGYTVYFIDGVGGQAYGVAIGFKIGVSNPENPTFSWTSSAMAAESNIGSFTAAITTGGLLTMGVGH